MKAFKILLPLLGLALVAAPRSHAQDNPPDQPRHGGKGGHGNPLQRILAQVSGITDDQQQKIQTIQEDFRSQAQAIRNDDSLSDDERRAKFQTLIKDAMAKVRAVLTADQQKQFDAAVAKMHERMGGHKGGEDAPPPPPPPST